MKILTCDRLIILALLIVFNFGCSSTSVENKDNHPPSTEQNKPVNNNVKRIVSLTSLSTDIIASLDQSKLVGIPGSSLLAKDSRLKDLTKVTEGRTPPNLEKIISLKPDMVIGAKGMHDQVLNKLNGMGIKTLSTEVNGWEALNNLTTELATLINANPQPLIDRYQDMLNKPSQSIGKTLLIAGDRPILSPNTNSWAGDTLNKLGIENAAAKIQGKSEFRGYVTLSPEQILSTNPDNIIIISTTPGSTSTIEKNSFWKELKAVKNDRVYTLDYYGMVNPGSIESIDLTTKKLREIGGS